MIKNTPAWWDELARDQPTSWGAAMWSKQSQDVRFRTVRSLLKISPGESVLDFGCGTGAFIDYLPAATDYYGYDWSPEMRARAREEHPRATILEDLGEELFDHVVAIGPFNLRANWSKEETLQTLIDLWALNTDITLVVSLYAGQPSGTMLSYSLEDAVEIVNALGPSSPRATLLSDHLPNDIIIRRQK